MKEMFLNYSLNLLINEYKYKGDDIDRIKYGLEIIYIAVTKITVILLLSILFGVFKETFIFTLFITPIRTFAYGMHAKSSFDCYISSIIFFMLFPYIFINIEFSLIQKILLTLFAFISMIFYAPADTHKRPLINAKHRKKLKYLSLCITSIYVLLIFVLNNTYITNLLIDALLTESLLINPITYKLSNMPYNNYETYQKETAKLQK